VRHVETSAKDGSKDGSRDGSGVIVASMHPTCTLLAPCLHPACTLLALTCSAQIFIGTSAVTHLIACGFYVVGMDNYKV
jgi:hypothetical protein